MAPSYQFWLIQAKMRVPVKIWSYKHRSQSPVSLSLRAAKSSGCGQVPMTEPWWAGAHFLAHQQPPLKFKVLCLPFEQNLQCWLLLSVLQTHERVQTLSQNKASRTICRWCWPDFHEQVLSFLMLNIKTWLQVLVFKVWVFPSMPYIDFMFSFDFFAWKISTGHTKVIAVKSNVGWP